MTSQEFLQSRIRQAMTVGEMIEELKNFDENDRVVFGYDFGDHNSSQVREPVKYIEDQNVQYSAYHKMLKEVPEDADLEDKTVARVIVIS